MRKQFLPVLCMFLVQAGNMYAQCPAGRYVSEIFSGYTKDSVLYSTPYSLYMDVYQPAGDTMHARPIIILGHGGSFIQGNGDRTNDLTVDSLCIRFAKRGYVTVSIDYRLTDYLTLILDSSLAIDEVIKAIGDGKAAVRYFVKDAATANVYKIDTNNIFVGGNSAGAVLYMHAIYLDSLGECPSYIASAMGTNGGFEGNSGNAGYTTKMKAVINLAGALNETSFVGHGDKPSVNCQGDADGTVPYDCGYPLGGFVHVNLCGLGALEPVYTANSIYHMSLVFPGDNHIPWAANPAKLNTVDSLVTVFLYSLVCGGNVSVPAVENEGNISLFPNPAGEVMHISSARNLKEIIICDQAGRVVQHASDIRKENYELNTSRLGKGFYFVQLKFADENIAPVTKKLVIQ